MSRTTRKAKPAVGAEPTEPGTGAGWLPVAAILAALLVAYLNAFSNPLVFDDASTIVTNGTIRSVAGSLAGGPVQSATAGRPLVNVTFAFDYALAGEAPWLYHLTNLVVLAACALVLFGLVRRALQLESMPALLRDRHAGIALATALLWAVHPLQTEVVNYATQRTESLMGLCYLATLYAGLRGMTASRPGWWPALSVAACAAGMACKESMATAPVVVLLFDATFIAGGLVAALRARTGYYASLAATWLLLAALIAGGPRSRSAGFASGVDPWTYLLNQAPMLVRYLQLAVAPFGLVVDYGVPRPLAIGDVWLPGLVVAALIVTALVAWARWSRAAFLGTTVFILLAPTSSFVPIATEVGAERRMFLPLAALLLLLITGAVRLLERLPDARRPRVAAAVTAAIALALVSGTFLRNREYASEVTLWQTVVDRWSTGRAHYNLGIALKAAGRRDEAVAAFERALADSPDAHYALGFARQEEGRLDEAASHYRRYIELRSQDTNVVRAYHQLGRALLAQGKHEEALAAFGEMLVRKPGDLDGLAGMADTQLALRRWSEAIATYQAYLSQNPNNATAQFNMGLALFEVDRFQEAATTFSAVIAREPSNVAAYVNLANALGSMGRYGDAVRAFQRAAELETDPAAKAALQATVRRIIGH